MDLIDTQSHNEPLRNPSWDTPWIRDGISPNACTEGVIKRRYPIVYDEMRYLYHDLPWPQVMWLWERKRMEVPLCKICGMPVKFHGRQKGYGEYCSPRCANADPEKKEAIRKTCLERYGVENPAGNADVKRRREETCRARYGYANAFADPAVRERIRGVLQERYGVDYASQSPEVQERRRKNSMEKYGVDHHMKTPEVTEKIVESNRRRIISDNPFIERYSVDGQWICKCPHDGCDRCKERIYMIWPDQYYARKEYDIEPCTNIYPIRQSHSSGTSLETAVRSVLDEMGVDYRCNVRDVIPPMELDIYIPEKHLAVECNGLRWHNADMKSKDYHMQKWIDCNSKGVQLVTFWEDQIRNNPEGVRDILMSKCGLSKRIYARKCEIDDNISSADAMGFLENNHLQGKVRSAVKIGLRYDGDLVSLMTFAQRSSLSGGKNETDIWELTRYCSANGVNVIGGAGKLLREFIKKYRPSKIISFSSNDISNGEMYRRLGFIPDEHCTRAYWYIDMKSLKRYHRSRFTKKHLDEMGYDVNGKTESEIMKDLPYWKIWDSGHMKWILDLARNND